MQLAQKFAVNVLKTPPTQCSQHSISLPEGTVVQSLTIDSTKQAIQQQQGKVCSSATQQAAEDAAGDDDAVDIGDRGSTRLLD